LSFGVEADRPFIPEHVGQRKEFLGTGQYLMGYVFALQFVVKIKLLELDVVPKVIAFYCFPGHHGTPLKSFVGLRLLRRPSQYVRVITLIIYIAHVMAVIKDREREKGRDKERLHGNTLGLLPPFLCLIIRLAQLS
jgi:hypothetical protein